MEILKLTSIRLSKSVLAQANELGHLLGYWKTSDVLRVAIWVGLKILNPGVLRELLHMMWEEEALGKHYSTMDVLRTAVKELENLK